MNVRRRSKLNVSGRSGIRVGSVIFRWLGKDKIGSKKAKETKKHVIYKWERGHQKLKN